MLITHMQKRLPFNSLLLFFVISEVEIRVRLYFIKVFMCILFASCSVLYFFPLNLVQDNLLIYYINAVGFNGFNFINAQRTNFFLVDDDASDIPN